MKDYCISYSYRTIYETEWFRAKTKKEAIQRVKDVAGNDIKIEHVIEKKNADNDN